MLHTVSLRKCIATHRYIHLFCACLTYVFNLQHKVRDICESVEQDLEDANCFAHEPSAKCVVCSFVVNFKVAVA